MNFEISENTVLAVPFILKGRRLEGNERVRFRCMFRNHEGDFPYVLDMEEDNKGESGPDGKFTISLDTSKYGIRPGRYSFDLSLVLESGSLITLMRKSDCQIKINATEDGLEKPNGDVFFGADFIVEEGVKDGWTYRKWNSGEAQCRGTIIFTPPEAVAAGGSIRPTKSFPFVFATAPDVFVHTGALAYKIKKTYPLSSTGSVCGIYAKLESDVTLSVTETVSFLVEAKGRWK